MTKNFCIMTTGRAGSTSLMYALRQFEDIALPSNNIQCEDEELVHPTFKNKYIEEYKNLTHRDIGNDSQLIDLFFEYNKNFSFVGFKSMPRNHKDSPEFLERDDVRFIVLYRRDIASTVASFIMAERSGSWRRYGGNPDKTWFFEEKDIKRVNDLIVYIISSNRSMSRIPNAIRLSYEEICQPHFKNQELDDFFGREIKIDNPRPPTTGASYVVNWDVFRDYVQKFVKKISSEINMKDASPVQKQQGPIPGATDEEEQLLRKDISQKAFQLRDDFAGLQTFCLFIGYPRSGHSIIGSLLDAHPDIVIGHELDMIKFLDAGFSAEQIYCLLLENSRLFTEHGRRTRQGYNYCVNNQWQGEYADLKVIGDKKGGGTSIRIGNDPALLEKLTREVKLNIRFIHVVCNPYDNIAALIKKEANSIPQAVLFYAHLCKINQMIISKVDPSRILELHHDDFVADPQAQLVRLCEYLGVAAGKNYLEDCASIVYKKSNKRGDSIKWSPQITGQIKKIISEFEFLKRY